jgi:hypothetical protein
MLKVSEVITSSFFRAEEYIDEDNNIAKCIPGYSTPRPITMFMFILNLGYLFRFGCLASEATRREKNIRDTVQKAEMLQSPRCIKSHLPLQLLPEQLWTVKPKAKYPSFT